MERQTAAEAFPALYRAILDEVAELEQAGLRAESHRIRWDATAAYSGAWGETNRRRLAALVVRIGRALATQGQPDQAVGAVAGPTNRSGAGLATRGSSLRSAIESR